MRQLAMLCIGILVCAMSAVGEEGLVISLNESNYTKGGRIELYITLDDESLNGTTGDLYIASITPSGELRTLSGAGEWQDPNVIVPWAESWTMKHLPKTLVYADDIVREMESGIYTWYLVLAPEDGDPLNGFQWLGFDVNAARYIPSPGTSGKDAAVLQAGDVLLYTNTSLLGEAIIEGEKLQYGSDAEYNHAALYLGKGVYNASTRTFTADDNGVEYVAEMQSPGLVVQELAASIANARNVDAFRHTGIGDSGAEVASAALAYIPTPYDFKELAFLGLIAADFPMTPLTKAALMAERANAGSSKMICSEMVRRAYRDVGLDPVIASYWTTLEEDGWITSDEHRLDYTTPNILAKSASFTKVGAVK